jgi:hypothetical protein
MRLAQPRRLTTRHSTVSNMLRARRGAARGAVVAALLALGAAAALLWLFLGDTRRAAPALEAGAADEVARDVHTSAALASPSTTDDGDELAAVRGAALSTGVRVRGEAGLRGRVVERDGGAPVAGAKVELLPVPPAGAAVLGRMLRMFAMGDEMWKRVQPIAVAATDARGEYAFRGVRPGTYYLEARGEWHAPDGVVRARATRKDDAAAADIQMLPAGRVVGVVLRPDGTPAPRAKLALVPGPGSFLTVARNGDVRFMEGETDESGRFAFDGVLPGAGWEITASSPEFSLTHARDIVVAAGIATKVELRARLGGTIVGRVVGEDADGARTPVAGAHLGAVPRGLRNLRCVEEVLVATHCETAADGSFTMPNVPAGEVDVVAISKDHLPAIGARAALDDGATLALDELVLKRGATVAGRVIDAAGAPLAGVTMRWNLVEWSNFGFDFSLAPLMAQAVKGFEPPTSGPDGRFVAGPIAGKPPYSIDFEKLGYAKTELKWDPAKDSGEAVVVLQQGVVVSGVVMDALKSEPVASFSIDCAERVDLDAAAPSPLNPFSGGVLFEDPAGRFELQGVRPGKARLSVSAPGYLAASVEVEVAPGAPAKGVIVELAPGGVVKGRVIDEDGAPIAGAQVVAQLDRPARGGEGSTMDGEPAARRGERRRGEARREARNMAMGRVGRGPQIPPGLMAYAASMGFMGERATTTGRDGTFQIAGVETGDFRVHAFHRDYCGASSKSLAMGEQGAVADVVLVMKAGGGIHGTVRDPRGNPVPDEIVVAVAPQSLQPNSPASVGGMYQGSTDAQGNYRIQHVAPGGYFVVATRGDEELNPMSLFGGMNFDLVTVPEGEDVRFDLVDTTAGGCRVHGVVTYRGEPVQRGFLSALNYETDSMLGVEWRAARMKGDGQYEFAGLAPGEYQLNFDGDGPQARLTLEVPDAPEARIDLALPEASIGGRVVDDRTGDPVKGATATLRSLSAEGGGGGMFGSFLSREGRTRRDGVDDQGVFDFDRLEGGNYELQVSAGGGDYAPSEPLRVVVVANRVEDGLVVRLLPALSIQGVVVDEQGAPIPDARVVAQPAGAVGDPRGASDRCDAQGAFEVRGLAAGEYDLVATAPGRASARVAGVKVARDLPPKPTTILLPRGTNIVAIVRQNGAPVAGARGRVVAKDAREGELDPEATGAMLQQFFQGAGGSGEDGRLDLGRHAAGEWRVEVQRASSARGVKLVKIDGLDGVVEVVVDLP